MRISLTALLSLFLISLSAFSVAAEEQLTRDQQIDIIKSYLYVTGHSSERPAALSQEEEGGHDVFDKCGTSEAMNFALNRHRIDKDLLESFGLSALPTRPSGLTLSLVSPSGRFTIHYTTSGTDAVYQSGVDVSPANGVPDYIDAVAKIADSAYKHTIVNLGYPAPPSDGFYPAGGDSTFDIYVHNLGGTYYGLSYIDSLYVDGPGTLRATSFMEIDNDYQEITPYKNRPLDAARVTVAHEYFHSVQFGIDWTESEDYTNPTFVKRYWMEMSAVWMEEEQYDNINDYYYYLPFFFNRPGRSIQQFTTGADLHPYGSAVFPIFLSELFGKSIIKSIWLHCRDLGIGPSFFDACEMSFDSALTGLPDSAKTFPLVFRQFVFWNYFTGTRASLPLASLGYSERANYPEIPQDSMLHFSDSILVTGTTNRRNPDHNAAAYLVWENPRCLATDTVIQYGQCYPNVDTCLDTIFVRSTDPHDFTVTDTFATVILSLDPTYEDLWGLVTIFEFADYVDSFDVAVNMLRGDKAQYLFIPNQAQYRSITFILTPTSIEEANYSAGNPIRLGVFVDEKVDPNLCEGFEGASFMPFPNPVVLSNMGEEKVRFLMKYDVTGEHQFDVDIFNEAGEYLTTKSQLVSGIDGSFLMDWDLKNAAGTAVASGVYLLYGRLFDNASRGELLAEKRTKLLIVR